MSVGKEGGVDEKTGDVYLKPMAVKIRVRLEGAHWKWRVFSAPTKEGTFALLGELAMSHAESIVLMTALQVAVPYLKGALSVTIVNEDNIRP